MIIANEDEEFQKDLYNAVSLVFHKYDIPIGEKIKAEIRSFEGTCFMLKINKNSKKISLDGRTTEVIPGFLAFHPSAIIKENLEKEKAVEEKAAEIFFDCFTQGLSAKWVQTKALPVKLWENWMVRHAITKITDSWDIEYIVKTRPSFPGYKKSFHVSSDSKNYDYSTGSHSWYFYSEKAALNIAALVNEDEEWGRMLKKHDYKEDDNNDK